MQRQDTRPPRQRFTWKQAVIAAAILALLVYLVAILIYAPLGGDLEEAGDSGLPGPAPTIVGLTPTP